MGVTSKNRLTEMCNQLFACETAGKDIAAAVLATPNNTPRATCKAAGALCPGVSIGCAMCGIFLPGTCGNQCIIAGLYCGVSAYACKDDDKRVLVEEDTAEAVAPAAAAAEPEAKMTTREEEIMAMLFGPRYIN